MDVLTPVSGAMTAARDGGPRKAEEVAKGFEGMFFSMLCKQMRETLEPGTLFGEDSGDVLGGLFDQFMGERLARAGSLGIAAMVRNELAKTNHEQHPDHPAAPRQAGPARP